VSLLAFAAAVPSPTPFPSYTGDPNLITPGVWGFVITFLVAVATVFLIIDMNRRIRRTRYREEIRLQLEAEAAAGAEPGTKPKVVTPPEPPAGS
jgi:hypothetical protein